MKFEILMGIPEMEEYWNDLCNRAENNTAGMNCCVNRFSMDILSLLHERQ